MEKFLTLMADLDDNSQRIMSDWYEELKSEGFTGVQTPGLPFHISLATFSLEDESKVLVKSFKPFEAQITRLHLCAFWPTREIETVQL